MDRYDLFDYNQDPEEIINQQQTLLDNYNHILTSEKEPSIVPDENSIVNSIHDNLNQSAHTSDKAYQFVHLYNKISTSERLGKRWSILYLFSLLNNLPTQREPSTSEHSASNIGLVDIESDHEPPFEDSPRIQRRRLNNPPQPPAVQLSIVRSYTQTKECDILRDLVFVFQGIDGQFIRLDPLTEEYLIDKQRLRVSESTEQLIYRLTETGWLYGLVKKYTESEVVGLVGQSLLAAIQNELTSYYKLIALVEAQVERQFVQEEPSLTLKGLLVWMKEANAKLRLMSILIDASHGQKGGALVNVLHNHTKHGDPFFKEFMANLLKTISQPFYDMLQRWVYEGELDDPYQEFFVACDLTVSESELWEKKYSIRQDMLPSFFSKKLASRAFSIGKSLNFMRYSCHDQHPLGFKYGEMEERVIDAIYLETSQRLLELLKMRYRLMDHLSALKRYLLLDQGDFMQCLMDALGHQLNEPAGTLFRHHLNNLLKTAIRSSNAQYDDPEILDRLDLKLLERQKNDVGWDVFTLDYHVDTPINAVIHADAMRHYLSIFHFLWRLKRVEHTLSISWKQCGKSNREWKQADLTQDLHEVQMTIQHMIHFIHQLQHFVLFEVLECSWKKLQEDIGKSIDLDSIIESHDRYLKEITGILRDESFASRLDGLFDVILSYKTVLDHLCTFASNEVARRHGRFVLDTNEARLGKIRRHHQEITQVFHRQVLQFLEVLKNFQGKGFGSLFVRLNENRFFEQ